MKKFFTRLRHRGTIIGLGGMVGLLLIQFGFKVDLVWLDTTLKLICGIAAMLGLMNDPTTPGVYNPLKK